MNFTALEFVGGLALALATVSDVFETVVVPGGSRANLRVARRLVFATLPVWRLAGRARGIPTSFAPFVLVASFVIWMLLLALGFALIIHSVGGDLRPPISSFPQAFYVAGTGLLTIGLGSSEPRGLLRWVLLAAGFCGLAIMTMAVTYLLEVQRGIGQRDAGMLKLTTTAGEPPSGLALLERYAALDFMQHIPEVMADGRDWCAHVLQSHASHPTLVYFRSKGTGSGWPAALGALMDMALAVEFLLEAPQWRGVATLLREDGGRTVEALIAVVGLDHEPAAPAADELDRLLSRLRSAGYPVRPEPDRAAFCAHRARHAACVRTMARHLGTIEAPLLPAAES